MKDNYATEFSLSSGNCNFVRSLQVKNFCVRIKVVSLIILLFSLSVKGQTYTRFTVPWKSAVKVGVKNDQGKVVIKPEYFEVTISSQDNFLLQEDLVNHEWVFSIVNAKGKKLAKVKNVNSVDFKNGFFLATGLKDNIVRVYDEKIEPLNDDKTIISPQSEIYGNICAVAEGNSYTLYDRKWKKIDVVEKYEKLYERTSDGKLAFSVKKNGKWGVYDIDYQEVLKPEYNLITYSKEFSSNNSFTLLVRKDKKTGFFNLKTQTVLPSLYDTIYKFNDKQYIGKYAKGLDIINNTGITTKFNQYDRATLFAKDKRYFVLVERNKKQGLVTLDERVIVPIQYDSISFGPNDLLISEQSFITYDNQKRLKGWYDVNGKELLPAIYQDIKYAKDSSFMVMSNNRWGVVKNNKTILPYEYEDIVSVNGGVTLVKKNNYWGALLNWKPAIECKYKSIEMPLFKWASSNCLIVNRNSKFGLINVSNNDSTGCKFQFIEAFKSLKKTGNIFQVRKDNKYDILYENGFKSAGIPYDRIVSGNDDDPKFVLLGYSTPNDFTYYNLETHALLPLIEKVIHPFKDGLARVSLSVLNVTNTIDENFKTVSPDMEFKDDKNCLVVWIDEASYNNLNLSRRESLNISITKNNYEIKNASISGGTKNEVNSCYPEDKDKTGFVKIILPRGKYRLYVTASKKSNGLAKHEWIFDIEFSERYTRQIMRLN